MNSPIDKLMNEFYHPTNQLSRPRILALLFRSNPENYSVSDILKLENVFNAKLSTAGSRLTEVSLVQDFPSEIVVLYDCPMRSADTKLFKQLHHLDPGETTFGPYFQAARYTLLEVGACASDLVWRRALKDIETRVPPSYEDEEVDGQAGEKPGKARSIIRRTIKNWVYAMPNLDSSSKGYNVTPKFSRLVQILDSCKPYGESFRGIVFGKPVHSPLLRWVPNSLIVQRRVIALALTDILRHLVDQMTHIRPYALTGLGSTSDSEDAQVRTFGVGVTLLY